VPLVEDEPDVAETLSWGLATEGYVVDTADNGVDGLWKATENAYDVVVLDVMLPGLDGYQVCRRLRERGKWTPILLLTAMDDDLDHAEGPDSGADDYLAKPFSYPVLLAHLRSLTRRTLGARSAVLTAGGLALDPASRTVARDGTPLDLTSREIAVLEHLLRRRGRVVSRSELLEHCWDAGTGGCPPRRRGSCGPATPSRALP
jgi:two-component system, OmpR family, response regulator